MNVLLGKGDGTFFPPTSSTNLPGEAWRSAAGDFNEDGLPDLAFTDLSEVTVELNNGQCQ